MKRTKLVKQLVEVAVSVVCNLCGLTLGPRHPDGRPRTKADGLSPMELADFSYGVSLTYSGGYYSHAVGDLIAGDPPIKLDICECCLADLCNKAKIKPEGWPRPWMKTKPPAKKGT